MRVTRVVVSILTCVLALGLSACGHPQKAVLYRAHDDPALRAHVHPTASTPGG